MSLERALKRSLQERNKVSTQKSSGKDQSDPSKKLPLHLQTGKYGEEKAAEYLTHIGYRIIAKNVSCRHGEIDIIADDGNEIVFVEVRTRSFGWLMPPECTVGPEKIKKLKSYNFDGFELYSGSYKFNDGRAECVIVANYVDESFYIVVKFRLNDGKWELSDFKERR